MSYHQFQHPFFVGVAQHPHDLLDLAGYGDDTCLPEDDRISEHRPQLAAELAQLEYADPEVVPRAAEAPYTPPSEFAHMLLHSGARMLDPWGDYRTGPYTEDVFAWDHRGSTALLTSLTTNPTITSRATSISTDAEACGYYDELAYVDEACGSPHSYPHPYPYDPPHIPRSDPAHSRAECSHTENSAHTNTREHAHGNAIHGIHGIHAKGGPHATRAKKKAAPVVDLLRFPDSPRMAHRHSYPGCLPGVHELPPLGSFLLEPWAITDNIEESSDEDNHNGDAGLQIPASCTTATERWEFYKRQYPHNGTAPPEKLCCVHCDAPFATVDEFVAHLDREKVHQENFCPDANCVFAVVGFRMRTLLRRHVARHHLKDCSNVKRFIERKPLSPRDRLMRRFLNLLYICPDALCSRAFYRKDSLQRHRRLIHDTAPARTRRRKLHMGKCANGSLN